MNNPIIFSSNRASLLSWNNFKITVQAWGHRITYVVLGVLLVGALAYLIKKVHSCWKQNSPSAPNENKPAPKVEEKPKLSTEPTCCLAHKTFTKEESTGILFDNSVNALIKFSTSEHAKYLARRAEALPKTFAEMVEKETELKIEFAKSQQSPSIAAGSADRIMEPGFESEAWTLGVFNGSGKAGKEVTTFAVRHFSNYAVNVTEPEKTIQDIHKRFHAFSQQCKVKEGFATANVTLITKTGRVYTSVLGDVNSFIFRKVGRNMKVIPLNYVLKEQMLPTNHQPEISVNWLQKNDVVLWNAGGILNRITLEKVNDVMFNHFSESPQEILNSLIEQASQTERTGNLGNISVILAKVAG